MSDTVKKNLGIVTAYAYARSKGYEGTEEEFAELMASYADVAKEAAQSASEAAQSAVDAAESESAAAGSALSAQQSVQAAAAEVEAAQAAKTGAEQAAGAASNSANTAAGRALEASGFADAAEQSAINASGSATAAQNYSGTAASAAQTASGYAGDAGDSATAAAGSATAAAASAAAAAESARTLTIDDTLTQQGQAADSKKTGNEISALKADLSELQNELIGAGDAIHHITGGDFQIVFTPTVITGQYIKSTDGVISQLNDAKIFYITCDANTEYIITKNAGACFTVGCTDELPANGITCLSYIVNATGTEIRLTTPSSAQYLVVWYYRTTDTDTADNLLASVAIKKHFDTIIPEISTTLDVSGAGADAKVVGDRLADINGGWHQITITSTTKNEWYLRSSDQSVQSSAGAKLMYFPCEPNTEYVISKLLSNRFSVGCVDSVPVIGEVCTNFVSSHSSTKLALTTTANSKYIIVFYWFSDSTDADTILASISVSMNYGMTLSEVKDEISNLYAYTDIAIARTKDLFFISASTHKIGTQNNVSSFYFACEPDTQYRITKELGNIFTVGCTSVTPVVDVLCDPVIVDSTADHIDITTPSDAEYMVVYYYFGVQDTYGEDAIYQSISVKKWMPLTKTNIDAEFASLKTAIGNIGSSGRNVPVYVGCAINAGDRANRFPAMRELMDIALLVEQDPTGDYSSLFTKAECGIICRLPMYNSMMFTGYGFDILFQKNANVQAVPASITKVMSLITGIDYITDLHERVTIISSDVSSGSGSTYADGDIMTLEDILFAMMVESSNTCSNTFARYCGIKMLNDNSATASACINEFIRQMNVKAVEIGMTNSNFTSPHGQPTNNISTAHDMLLATIYACSSPWILRAWRYCGRIIHVYGANERDITMAGYSPEELGTGFFVHGGKTGGLDGGVVASIVTIASPTDSN